MFPPPTMGFLMLAQLQDGSLTGSGSKGPSLGGRQEALWLWPGDAGFLLLPRHHSQKQSYCLGRLGRVFETLLFL